MSQKVGRSSIARRAQKLLEDASMFSSDSSLDVSHSNSIKYKPRTHHTDHLDTLSNTRLSSKFENLRENYKTSINTRSPMRKRSTSKKKKTVEIENNNASKNKSFEGKPIMKSSKKTPSEATGTPIKRDKSSLRRDISELQQTVVEQNKKLKKMYKSILNKRKEVNQLTDQLLSSRKRTADLLELEEKVRALEANEYGLMEYLKEQQKVSKEALGKLYELQDESSAEIERAKEYYKDFYLMQASADRNQSEYKLKKAEVDKEKLQNIIKNLEVTLSEERNNNKSLVLSGEVAVLQGQLNEKSIEIERMKFEIRQLKLVNEEDKKIAAAEIKKLKNDMEALLEHNKILKMNVGEGYTRNVNANHLIKRNVEEMEQQLYEKERIMYDKDAMYKEQLGQINEKVLSLQAELKMLTEYEEKIDSLTKEVMFKNEELQMVKKYYKEKLHKVKEIQRSQKDEWSSIYNELLGEIKQLKVEIDELGQENRKLSSSIKNRSLQNKF